MKEYNKFPIKPEQNYARVVLVIAALLICGFIYPQESVVKPSKQSALDAFKRGSYEVAFREFNILLLSYSKDPLYKYYAGVCLVKLKKEPDKAAVFLMESVEGLPAIRSVPEDSWFYLGRAQQMSGQFPEAIKSYTSFTELAGKKASKELNVALHIQECKDRRGELTFAESLREDTPARIQPEVVATNQPVLDEAKAPVVSNPVRPRTDLPPAYERSLETAMDHQVKADSLNRLAGIYKSELDKVPPQQKQSARERITDIERSAAQNQKSADEIFTALELKGDKNTETGTPLPSQTADIKPVNEPSISSAASKTPTEKSVQATQQSAAKTGGVYSLFEVAKNPAVQVIEIDPEMPQGLVYRIQTAVFSKPVNPAIFKGIIPVSGFRVTGTDAVRYYAGMFRRMADASGALGIMKQMGFRDAFIVAVFDGKPVSIERAALLEKEWGGKTLVTPAEPVPENQEKVSPPTLSFRVEVARVPKPVVDDMAETYRRMAGGRGLDILNSADGSFVYLIGKFITFESASEYSDLLVRNGYREAKVVAWLGDREIPVETAKQLFERLE